MSMELKGSCSCASVSFSISEELSAPDACHCVQCRKQSGHFFASANVPKAALTVTGAENLTWFQSSVKVRRGFCSKCGSALFWDPLERDWLAVSMGSFDTPTSTHLEKHIFVGERGDYYEIEDGLPQER